MKYAGRHGIRQLRSGWADGPAYITQCPIQTGQSYVYNFTIVGQRGTLWWHAHHSWLRATVYGPFIILPKRGVPYPFPEPYKEVPILFGNADPHLQLIFFFFFLFFFPKPPQALVLFFPIFMIFKPIFSIFIFKVFILLNLVVGILS